MAILFFIIFTFQAQAADSCAPKVAAAKTELRSKSAEKVKFTYAENAIFACAHQAALSGRNDVRGVLRRAVLACEQVAATRSLAANTDCYFRAASAASGLLKL